MSIQGPGIIRMRMIEVGGKEDGRRFSQRCLGRMIGRLASAEDKMRNAGRLNCS
jgi:hypothetical protein